MARRKHRRTGRRTAQPETVHPEAAGLDVGATAIYAAVRADRATPAIRNFPTFTSDLHALADWLKECQVTTVAMESTGVYWIPVFQILEARGFEVVLVNARLVRSVPGRKSDVADCEWLRHLHSVGLLRGSFRPPDEVCALRTLLRHRDTLVKSSSRSVLHMQKSYDQMNIHPAPCDQSDRGDRHGHNRRHPGAVNGTRRGWPRWLIAGSKQAAPP